MNYSIIYQYFVGFSTESDGSTCLTKIFKLGNINLWYNKFKIRQRGGNYLKKIRIILITTILMIALPSIVYGDIGPKPSIEIIVKKIHQKWNTI